MSGQNPLDKLKSVDWRGLARNVTNKVKQYALNLSPLEVMVEEATNLDTWGPHGSVMNDIAEACYDPEGYRQVLGVIARRLQEGGDHWRMCYKALLLLEHIIKHGPPKVAEDVSNSTSVLERLQRFEYKDANARDHGANVRHRAKEIAELVSDPAKLREEREKARINRQKYTGVSAAEMRSGGGGYGSSSARGRGFDPASLVRPGGGPSSGFESGGGGGYNNGRMQGFGSTSMRSSAAVPPTQRTSPRRGGDDYFEQQTSMPSNRRNDDAVAATRERIEKLKLEQERKGATKTHRSSGDDKDGGAGRKRLTDVKVNPKIAASLGLKPIVATPKETQQAHLAPATAAVVPSGPDLLGDLLEDDAAPAQENTIQGSGGGWDAFGVVKGEGGGQGNGNGAAGAPAFDPFAAPNSPSSTMTTAAASKASSTPTKKRGALPEDAFSDLLGGVGSKIQQPMGSPKTVATRNENSYPAATSSGEFAAFEADFSGAGAAAGSPALQGDIAVKDPFADLLR